MAHKRVLSGPAYESHFAAIGRLAETWAQLEFAIDMAIWGLAGVPQALGACITSQMYSVNSRMRAFRSLAVALGASKGSIKKIGKLQGTLGNLQTIRNRAVHDPRMENTTTGDLDRLQVTAENRLEFGWQPESAETLLAFRDQIEERIKEFTALLSEIEDEIYSLPDIDRPPLPQMKPVQKNAKSQTNG